MAGTRTSGKVIVVASGKGGVGKTNLALNLGIQFSRQGARTILLDADFGHANADILLNIAPRADVADLLDPDRCLEDLLSEGPEGLGVICGISGLRHERSVCETDPVLYVGTVLRLRRSCDVLIVDCGAGVTGAAASFALAGDHLILVTTPEPTAVADSYASLKLLFQRGLCVHTGVVVNMAPRPTDAADAIRRLQRVAQQFLGLALENLGWIPIDGHVVRSVRAREPFVTRFPRCPASLRVAAIARRLHRPISAGPAPTGVWGRVASLFF